MARLGPIQPKGLDKVVEWAYIESILNEWTINT